MPQLVGEGGAGRVHQFIGQQYTSIHGQPMRASEHRIALNAIPSVVVVDLAHRPDVVVPRLVPCVQGLQLSIADACALAEHTAGHVGGVARHVASGDAVGAIATGVTNGKYELDAHIHATTRTGRTGHLAEAFVQCADARTDLVVGDGRERCARLHDVHHHRDLVGAQAALERSTLEPRGRFEALHPLLVNGIRGPQLLVQVIESTGTGCRRR